MSKKAASGFKMSDFQNDYTRYFAEERRRRVFLSMLLAVLCWPSATFSQVPNVDAPATAPVSPAIGAALDSKAPQPPPPVGPKHNAENWHYPHTPMLMRLGLAAGMAAGGPIRYNTRFPEVKPDPHPTSYFIAPSFVSIEVEYSFTNGALLLGLVSRKDLAHQGIKSRRVTHEGDSWTVDSFAFSDTGIIVGWIFGERFNEAWWWADLAVIGDRGGVDAKMTRSSVPSTSHAQVNITAVSFRARASAGIFNAGPFQLSAGPEIHLPVWYRLSDQSDLELRSWVSDTLALKASGSLGLAIMTSLRF